MRILLIEDHHDTAQAISKLLSLHTHEVVIVGSRAEAHRICTEDRHFDLMICDIGLPDGEGWDLARLAQKEGSRAIALTGYGMPDDIERSKREGFATHLLKPVEFTQLEEAIDRAFVGEERP